MSEPAPTWRTSHWITLLCGVLLAAVVVLLVAAAVALGHTGGCQPPPAHVVREGLLWLTVITLAAPLPWVAVAFRSPTPGRWFVASLTTLAPALAVLLAYAASRTHQFLCIPF